MKKIIAIIGARPQFIKHAPLEVELGGHFDLMSIHTGQHYDDRMSSIFFSELNMREPSYRLEIGSGEHGVQTGRMLAEIEPILQKENPDLVLVYGDTNSTVAGSLAAAKLHLPLMHIEAGLRSYNKKMPEEINRVIVDHISDYLICPTKTAIDNLKKEGINRGVFETGDVMKDMVRLALERNLLQLNNSDNKYYFATIHRPYNTDDPERLKMIINSLNSLTYPVKFSIHPRTLKQLKSLGLLNQSYSNLEFIRPVSYFESLNLQYNSLGVITDSGGIQKEAYLLKKKCITIRSETEWIETLKEGWNILVFEDLSNLNEIIQQLPGGYNDSTYGDGYSCKSIKNIILSVLN